MKKKEYIVPKAQLFVIDLRQQITIGSPNSVTTSGLDDDEEDEEDENLHYDNHGASQWLAW
jgi:hypothetical protein